MDTEKLIDIRSTYCELIRRELMGPGSEISIPDAEHELITSLPYQRYSIGVIYPQDAFPSEDDAKDGSVVDDVDDAGAIGEDVAGVEDTVLEETVAPEENPIRGVGDSPVCDEDTLDEEVELATQRLPSSFGINFMVEGEVTAVRCHIKGATYWKSDIFDYKYPVNRKFDKTLFLQNGLNEVFSASEDGKYFVLANGVSSDVAKSKLNDVHNALKASKESEKTETQKKYIDELYWQYDLVSKANSYLHKKGYIRSPFEKDYLVVFDKDYTDIDDRIADVGVKVTALRRTMPGNKTAITLMLVNCEHGRPDGRNCLYQPEISICSVDNASMKFVPLQSVTDFASLDEEEKILALQYRNKQAFASGLGVSADWQIDEHGYGRVATEFMPSSEVPSMDFNVPLESGINQKALSMRFLSDMDETAWTEKSAALRSVIDAYGKWIDGIEGVSLEPKFAKTASELIAKCRESQNRMSAGLSILDTDDNARMSFGLANRAMYMQRFHIKLQEKTADVDRFNGDEELSAALRELTFDKYNDAYRCGFDSALLNAVAHEKYDWRMFQLAFLLVSIPGMTNEKSVDRDFVDLIWFPTGGGKTEAYLGLTAFTIFYRRLAHANESGGTTVIMRYTLRLLAAQQFTRASTLICACETIRKELKGVNLGRDKITIGLWIGGEHTPNHVSGAESSAKTLLGKLDGNTNSTRATPQNLEYRKERYYKFQLLKCPWCGTKMVKEVRQTGDRKQLVGDWGAWMLRGPERFRFHCPQEDCVYEDELPVQVVDDELYRNPPTLLFATVDKFAMMAWKSQIKSFFAADAGDENWAPELIIQDELHLISGPLGTMVAMYETAIDALCSTKGVKPKIVASTATIRRATAQCGALYNRDLRQFPSPGIDAGDSFFSRESKVDYSQQKYGRLYIGLMPAGKSKATMQIRAIAALMQKIKDMEIPDDLMRDRYWTLTAYFNSLRDLGKCSTLVCDDVKDSIRFMKGRLSTRHDARNYTLPDELTSRVTTTELNKTLDKLEKNTFSSTKPGHGVKKASDIVLATNMISVGIDVARLNVMLMVGQPKLTSEYIQASSRVGRSDPGVVFVQYDAGKSRDRSHYEQFRPYHEGFYRYVEPTGATPFSRPAIDRAIHAVLVSLLRAKSLDYQDEPNTIDRDDSVLRDSVKTIMRRMEGVLTRINPNSKAGPSQAIIQDEIDYAKDVLDRFVLAWSSTSDAATADHLDFNYGEKHLVKDPAGNELRLLKPFGKKSSDEAFDTLTSMRNVDGSVQGSLIVES